MKKISLVITAAFLLLAGVNANAQDKSKRPSQPDKVSATLANGTEVSVDYSQPLLKGRVMGKDIEPMAGKVWRAGANEATVFEVSKDVTVQGKALPAGKYSLYMLSGDSEWTIIFNKTADQWGAFDYKAADDVIRVKAKASKGTFSEKLTYTIAKDGTVTINWGDHKVDFKVK